MLPRLQLLWTHLERQEVTLVPAVEKVRWVCVVRVKPSWNWTPVFIRNRMALLKQRLADIDTQKSTQRKHLGRMIRVALVGYTNVENPTLLNLMAKSDVFAENKLFATRYNRTQGDY